MWYFMHLHVVYIYYIRQLQVRRQVHAAEPASTETHSNANTNLEKNLRNLHQEACCARQITSTTLIAKTNQENSPHKPACNDKRITGLKNAPTGKTGRSCHPSKREGHAGMPPSDTQQGKEEQRRTRNAWRHNQAVYTQEPAAKGSCSSTGVVPACLKLWRKEYSCMLCLLCCKGLSSLHPPAAFSAWSPNEQQELI